MIPKFLFSFPCRVSELGVLRFCLSSILLFVCFFLSPFSLHVVAVCMHVCQVVFLSNGWNMGIRRIGWYKGSFFFFLFLNTPKELLHIQDEASGQA